jgi:hypothetical protein
MLLSPKYIHLKSIIFIYAKEFCPFKEQLSQQFSCVVLESARKVTPFIMLPLDFLDSLFTAFLISVLREIRNKELQEQNF